MDNILIIEDDKAIAELERDYLELNGFSCDMARSGETGLEKARSGDYALILLDIMLPGMDGFEVLRRLRETKRTPVIFMTAKNDEIDKIRGLGMGADDYMTKPFGPNEMVARVKAHINRHRELSGGKKRENVIVRGDMEIDTAACRVKVGSREVTLTAKEYALLLYLARNPGITLSKDRIFDRIWGMDACGDVSTVTVHVQRIREKLGRSDFIQTVWGIGYRFNEVYR